MNRRSDTKRLALCGVLAALLAPEKESAVLFAFFGYYPMLRKSLNRLRPKFRL